MNNYVSFYHRIIKFDFIEEEKGHIQRISTALLPVISLYKPAGMVVNFGMNGVRLVNHVKLLACADSKGDLAIEVFHTSVCIIGIASSVFGSRVAMQVMALHDLVQNIAEMTRSVSRGEFDLMLLLETAGSGVYVLMLSKHSVELTLLSFSIQAMIEFSKSARHFQRGEILEGLSKVVMGSARSFGALQQGKMLYRKRVLLRDPMLVECLRRLKSEKSNTLKLSEGDLQGGDLGTHVTGFGQELVKNDHLSFWQKDGKTTLIFRVNHVVREQLAHTIDQYRNLDQNRLSELMQIEQLDPSSLTIELDKQVFLPLRSHYTCRVHQFSIKKLGSLSIGTFGADHLLKNEVRVEIEGDADIKSMQKLLALLDLQRVFEEARSEDIQRMKIWHLFRTFYPGEAYPMERSKDYFFMDPVELMHAISERVPQMQVHFENDLPKMQLIEIMPGQYVYGLKGLADDLRAQGALGLRANLTGEWEEESQIDRIVNIIDKGMLSTDMRAKAGINVEGMSSATDYLYGSADRVFTRLVTERNLGDDDFGVVQLLFSVDAMETGSYQYHYDEFGDRVNSIYQERPDVFSFVDSQVRSPTSGNEVMIRNSIRPEWITGIIADNDAIREGVIMRLREKGMIQSINNQEMILGQHVNDFFVRSFRDKVFPVAKAA
ncbi:MAG: hypothetical protein KDK44_06350 [Chlamydiia bacterium]|nr:hypothetical protein [Chlamydiia bacterium]